MNLLENIPYQKADQYTINDLGKSVAKGLFESVGEMIGTTGKLGADLLSMLMEPVYITTQTNTLEPPKLKKKKKKGVDQSQGIQR